MTRFRVPPLLLFALACLVAGAMLGSDRASEPTRATVWMIGVVLGGLPVVWQTARGMLRGHFAADIVASLAIIGAVVLGEPLAGLVVVIMQTGGEALEAWAVQRASNAVAALEADAPREAARLGEDGTVETVDARVVRPGDHLLVRPGALVPCDVVVLAGQSSVDTSRLTGEPIPVRAHAGTALPSGAVNGEGALTVRAMRVAADSQYARIVELVRRAQASKSPLQRLADRWAVWFTPLTLLVCAAAWLVSRDPARVLAVLVVATPCPLILAAPVAFIGGVSRAARRGIIVRHGGALEALATVDTAVFDKTGTVTVGKPSVAAFEALGAVVGATEARELLAAAAAVELGSGHLLARVVVAFAETQGVRVAPAEELLEEAGRGVAGVVAGVPVAVGSARFVAASLPALADQLDHAEIGRDGLRAYVGTGDGRIGRLTFADALRPELPSLFAALRAQGVGRTLLLSGDHSANVARTAETLGVTEYAGDLRPEDKVARIAALQRDGARVLMVGDGTNDAPALSTAQVGVALAGHGGGVSAEAADVVLLVDEPQRVADAVAIGRDTMRIARQSIGVGLGLSVVGMGLALAGLLPPTAGAIAQEVIDVAVILNALRAARG